MGFDDYIRMKRNQSSAQRYQDRARAVNGLVQLVKSGANVVTKGVNDTKALFKDEFETLREVPGRIAALPPVSQRVSSSIDPQLAEEMNADPGRTVDSLASEIEQGAMVRDGDGGVLGTVSRVTEDGRTLVIEYGDPYFPRSIAVPTSEVTDVEDVVGGQIVHVSGEYGDDLEPTELPPDEGPYPSGDQLIGGPASSPSTTEPIAGMVETAWSVTGAPILIPSASLTPKSTGETSSPERTPEEIAVDIKVTQEKIEAATTAPGASPELLADLHHQLGDLFLELEQAELQAHESPQDPVSEPVDKPFGNE